MGERGFKLIGVNFTNPLVQSTSAVFDVEGVIHFHQHISLNQNIYASGSQPYCRDTFVCRQIIPVLNYEHLVHVI